MHMCRVSVQFSMPPRVTNLNEESEIVKIQMHLTLNKAYFKLAYLGESTVPGRDFDNPYSLKSYAVIIYNPLFAYFH